MSNDSTVDEGAGSTGGPAGTETTVPQSGSGDVATDPGPPSAAAGSAAAGGSEATAEQPTKRKWRGRSSAAKVPKHDKAKDKPEKKEKKVAEKETQEKKRGSDFGRNVDFDLGTVRNIVGRVIWLVCLVFALSLALTALFVALDANTGNEAVVRIYNFANGVDLGIFDLENPIKDFNNDQGPSQDVGTALFNYGIAAIVWLIIGRVADRVIRP